MPSPKKASMPSAAAASGSGKNTHPTWVDMIKECIALHPEDARTGVSRPTIKKFVETKYHIQLTPTTASQLNRAIASGSERGVFVLPKGLSGKVKLAPKAAKGVSKAQVDAAKENAKPVSKKPTQPKPKSTLTKSTTPKKPKPTSTTAAATIARALPKPKTRTTAVTPKPKPKVNTAKKIPAATKPKESKTKVQAKTVKKPIVAPSASGKPARKTNAKAGAKTITKKTTSVEKSGTEKQTFIHAEKVAARKARKAFMLSLETMASLERRNVIYWNPYHPFLITSASSRR